MSNPLKTMKKLRGVFVSLKPRFGFTLWVNRPTIFPVSNGWYNKIVNFHSRDVLWKDKYDTPRFEASPYFEITFFRKWSFWIIWDILPFNIVGDISDYWEQALWYLYYYGNTSYGCNSPDIEIAKRSWPWQDMNGNSTWTDEFLIRR